MQFQILNERMAILDIHLDDGETIIAEAGADYYVLYGNILYDYWSTSIFETKLSSLALFCRILIRYWPHLGHERGLYSHVDVSKVKYRLCTVLIHWLIFI